jgi:hypothetical protein
MDASSKAQMSLYDETAARLALRLLMATDARQSVFTVNEGDVKSMESESPYRATAFVRGAQGSDNLVAHLRASFGGDLEQLAPDDPANSIYGMNIVRSVRKNPDEQFLCLFSAAESSTRARRMKAWKDRFNVKERVLQQAAATDPYLTSVQCVTAFATKCSIDVRMVVVVETTRTNGFSDGNVARSLWSRRASSSAQVNRFRVVVQQLKHLLRTLEESMRSIEPALTRPGGRDSQPVSSGVVSRHTRSIPTASLVVPAQTPQPPFSVFISHSHDDGESARALLTCLEACLKFTHPVRCTSSPGHDYVLGQRFGREVVRDLHQSEVVIALITRKSLKSSWAMFELTTAIELEKPVCMLLGPDVAVEDLPEDCRGFLTKRLEDADAIPNLLDALPTHIHCTPNSRRAIHAAESAFREHCQRAFRSEPKPKDQGVSHG